MTDRLKSQVKGALSDLGGTDAFLFRYRYRSILVRIENRPIEPIGRIPTHRGNRVFQTVNMAFRLQVLAEFPSTLDEASPLQFDQKAFDLPVAHVVNSERLVATQRVYVRGRALLRLVRGVDGDGCGCG